MKKALALLLLSSLGLTAGCASQEQEEVVIGLTYVPNVQFAPYYVALDEGYFDDEGISVELRHHGQDEDLFGALTQGKEDIVVAGGAEMLQANDQGIDAVTFQTLYASYPVAVIVAQDSPIESLGDLEGKTLGVPGRFGETWFGALAFLEQAGLDEKDVEIKEIGFTQQAALSEGHVDAVVGFANNDIPQFKATGLDVRAIDFDPIPVVGVGNGTTSSMISEHPEVIEAVTRATKRAVEDIVNDPSRAFEAAQDHLPGTITAEQREVMEDVIEATSELYGTIDSNWGVPDLEVWQEMNDFMANVDLIEHQVDLDDVVTDDFGGKE